MSYNVLWYRSRKHVKASRGCEIRSLEKHAYLDLQILDGPQRRRYRKILTHGNDMEIGIRHAPRADHAIQLQVRLQCSQGEADLGQFFCNDEPFHADC